MKGSQPIVLNAVVDEDVVGSYRSRQRVMPEGTRDIAIKACLADVYVREEVEGQLTRLWDWDRIGRLATPA